MTKKPHSKDGCKPTIKPQKEAQRERVIQDLIAGKPVLDIAEREGISARWVSEIQRKNIDRIREGVRAQLDERQKAIDAFLEKEMDDFMAICRMATVQLKTALELQQEKAKTGTQYYQTEVIIKEQEKPTIENGKRMPGKEKTIRNKPFFDIEAALAVFKDTHHYLLQVQKNGD